MRPPAAFINAIAERRSFKEAITHLQVTWDELCDSKESAYKDGLRAVLEALLTKHDDFCERRSVKFGEQNDYAQAILDCIAMVETLIKDTEQLS